VSRNQAILLRGFAIWTIWVWSTRIYNILGNAENDIPFKVVHSLLASVSIVFAVAALIVVRQIRRAR